MAGLNEAGIDVIFASRPQPNPAAQPGALGMERADAIRGEIYRRHRIAPDTPLAEAMKQIEQRSQMRAALGVDGGQPSAWANPEERARAREEYARQGKTPAEVNKRWEESTHLLDPRTYQYMQNFGRDLDFLQAQSGLQQPPAADTKAWTGSPQSEEAFTRKTTNADAIRHYDSNRRERLSGAGGLNPAAAASGYQRWNTTMEAVLDNTSNPDVPAGNYISFSEVYPNYRRLEGSGEPESSDESWRRANAIRLASNRYRMTSPHPILDVASDSTDAEIASRIAGLQQEVRAAQVPMADERWQRTWNWTPPGFLTDAGDFAISMSDPTALYPAAKGVGALTNAAKAAARGARIAGSGWIAPAVHNAIRPVAKDFTYDMGVEQAAGAGMSGAMGGQIDRSDKQFWLGGGKPGVDFSYKTDEEVAEARRAGDQLHSRLKDDDGVSRADSEAYNRMRADGTLPNPPKFYWGMSPSGPAY